MRRRIPFSQASSGRIGSDSSGRAAPSLEGAGPIGRADLHAHSRHSRPCGLPAGPSRGIGAPEAIYRAAKGRAMDFVTLTDRDTIAGCLEFLERHPHARDFFVSEEVTARDPRSGIRLHVLLFGLTEAQHREAQRLKEDVRALLLYARVQGIAAVLGPFLDALPERTLLSDESRRILRLFERFEVRNGAAGRAHNQLVSRLVDETMGGRSFGVTAGSGAHGPARIGRTATLARAATRDAFLASLRAGRTWAWGEDGSLWTATADLLRVMKESGPVLGAGAPLLRHQARRRRLEARIRKARRGLDRMVITRFKEKTRTYVPGAAAADPGSMHDAPAAVGPDAEDRSQRLVYS